MPTIQRTRSVQYKTLDASIQEVTGRHIEFIASQEVQDRDGDVIEVAGIDTTDFMRNPVFLGDHNKEFILGKITKLWKERLPDGPALLAKAELLPAGVSARADERYYMIKFGAAKGISIGFRSHAHEPTPTGYRYKSIELIEMSQVAVPSCPTCVITSKSRALHATKEERMYHTTLEDRVAQQLAGLFADQIVEKEDTQQDWFGDMLRQMNATYPADHEYRMLMEAQMSLLGPAGSIADLVRGIMAHGVSAPKHWDDGIDIDERQVARLIADVIAEETGKQTRLALNAALGRLD